MHKLDEKDKKILFELDKNSRATDSEIGKNVGLSKQTVNYRINNLKHKGVIDNFYTAINVSKFGIDSYYVFLNFKNINKKKEREIIDSLNEFSFTGWIVNGIGKWDAITLVYAKSPSSLNENINRIFDSCKNQIENYSISSMIESEHLGYGIIKKSRSFVKQEISNVSIKLKHIDKKIIKTISQNARMPIIEIAEKIKEPVHNTNYALKNLIKNEIIDGFKPRVNISKIGLQWFLLLINFRVNDPKKILELEKFLKRKKEIYYITQTIGEYNLMIDCHVSSAEQLKEIIYDMKDNFSDLIKSTEVFLIFNEHKIDYFPEELI